MKCNIGDLYWTENCHFVSISEWQQWAMSGPKGKNVSVVDVGRVREMLGQTYLTLMNGCCTRYSGPRNLS
jgi:hypothetical protein